VTRGALYHHFADKADLCAAVLAQVEAEIAQRVAGAVAGFDPADTTGMLLAGAGAWLDASSEPDLQRIVLLDGPSVLGWDKWREICLRHTVGLIAALLQDGIDRGSLPPQPVQALTHLLVGAVDEAALYIAQADDAATARADMDLLLIVIGELLPRGRLGDAAPQQVLMHARQGVPVPEQVPVRVVRLDHV